MNTALDHEPAIRKTAALLVLAAWALAACSRTGATLCQNPCCDQSPEASVTPIRRVDAEILPPGFRAATFPELDVVALPVLEEVAAADRAGQLPAAVSRALMIVPVGSLTVAHGPEDRARAQLRSRVSAHISGLCDGDDEDFQRRLREFERKGRDPELVTLMFACSLDRQSLAAEALGRRRTQQPALVLRLALLRQTSTEYMDSELRTWQLKLEQSLRTATGESVPR